MALEVFFRSSDYFILFWFFTAVTSWCFLSNNIFSLFTIRLWLTLSRFFYFFIIIINWGHRDECPSKMKKLNIWLDFNQMFNQINWTDREIIKPALVLHTQHWLIDTHIHLLNTFKLLGTVSLISNKHASYFLCSGSYVKLFRSLFKNHFKTLPPEMACCVFMVLDAVGVEADC